MIWNAIKDQSDEGEHFMFLLNTRKDRQDRAIRLVDMMSKLDYSSIGLIGESLDMVVNMCEKQDIKREHIHVVDYKTSSEKYTALCEVSKENTTIIAIGNMGAGGANLADYFEEKHNTQSA